MKLLRTFAIMLIFAALLHGISFALVEIEKDNKDKESVSKKSQLMQKIESRLGRELTQDENRAYLAAVRKVLAELESIQQKFVKDIAETTGLTTGKIWDWIPQPGKAPDPKFKKMISKIEKELDRKLKREEIDKIMKADEVRNKGFLSAQEKFAKELSNITGISAKDIMLMLSKAEVSEK